VGAPCRELLLTPDEPQHLPLYGWLIPRDGLGQGDPSPEAVTSGELSWDPSAPVGQSRVLPIRLTSRLAANEVPKTKRIRGPNVMAAALPTKYRPSELD
jgi:hypothetical protein